MNAPYTRGHKATSFAPRCDKKILPRRLTPAAARRRGTYSEKSFPNGVRESLIRQSTEQIGFV